MKRVLVVDDDPMITKLVKVNLELSEFVVEEAWDGDTALKVLKSDAPDLMVLDLMMPRTDGWDILKMVRERQDIKDLPIILLTAKIHDEDLIRGWEMGADDYVIKPFDPVQLSDRVKAILDSTLEERIERRKREIERLSGR